VQNHAERGRCFFDVLGDGDVGLGAASGPDQDWLETILQRMVGESAVQRPGQFAVLSRITEVLFVEVPRSWIKSLGPGEGGWLGAIGDPHIGKALQLIHEGPERAWTLRELGRHTGLGRSAFSARFYKARRPARAPLPGSASDGRGRVHVGIGRRRHRSNCDLRRL
jgi:hypothetical protein